MAWTHADWAEEQLKRCAEAIESAIEGDRNNALFREAARMADYVDDGAITEQRVRAELGASARRAGLSGHEIPRTIDSAFERAEPGNAWYPSEGGGAVPISQVWGNRASEASMGLPTRPVADQKLHVVYYSSVKEPQGRRIPWTWADLVSAVEEPVEGGGDLALWAFHDIENDSRARIKTREGRSRAPKVAALHALALDYDDEPAFSKGSVQRWWGSVQHVAHTTRSHQTQKDKKPAGPRGRVIVALSRPVTPEEMVTLTQWLLEGDLGHIAAPELKSVARSYFVPKRTELYWSATNLNGLALDVDAIIAKVKDSSERDPATWDALDMVGGDNPRPRPTVGNIVRVLQLDPKWTGSVHWCEFRGERLLRGKVVRDVDEAKLALTVGDVYKLHVSSAKCAEALDIVADEHPVHPVRTYLETLEWDGEQRIDHWLARYLGCKSDLLSAEMGLRWMVGAVARIMEPGCKMDTTLILVGRQGARKSTALRVLAGADWFSDTAIDLRNKDAYGALQGVWIYEWPELDSMRRSEVNATKAFLTAQVDRFRPAYGRNFVIRPRQTLFVGTTNEANFLSDTTGSRRFWIREVGTIDLDALQADRDQLWAEAVQLYRADVNWWLPPEIEDRRAEDAESYQHVDPWIEPIQRYMHNAAPATIAEVLEKALDKTPSGQTRGDAMRAGGLLQQLGYVKQRRRINGRQAVVWGEP